MRIGPFRHRITLEEEVDTQDGVGGNIKTWTSRGTFWASVEPRSGKEYFAAQQVQSDATVLVRMRHNPLIAPTRKWRILYGIQVFDIEDILDVMERGREWQFMVKERHQDGFRD